MTRLPRPRKGKTPIDVTNTSQNGVERVRVTVGFDYRTKTNSDLSPEEVRDLIVLLQYHLAIAEGHIKEITDTEGQ